MVIVFNFERKVSTIFIPHHAFLDAEVVTGDLSAEDTTAAVIHIKLAQAGGLSIRKYTTKVSEDKSIKAQPDYESLTVHTEQGLKPTIPGTSWAGAFRHGMKRLGMTEKEAWELFGMVDEKHKIREKSKIRFGETVLENTREKILSRNAIDRFTGGTRDRALFTEKTVYEGSTTLTIGLEKRGGTSPVTDRQRRILAAAIADLHNGFLAVGGETSVGRGLFVIEAINGRKVTDSEQVFEMALQAIEEVTA